MGRCVFPIMAHSHQIICSRLSDRTLGAAPIASNDLKPVRSDSPEQIYLKIIWCEWSISCIKFGNTGLKRLIRTRLIRILTYFKVLISLLLTFVVYFDCFDRLFYVVMKQKQKFAAYWLWINHAHPVPWITGELLDKIIVGNHFLLFRKIMKLNTLNSIV